MVPDHVAASVTTDPDSRSALEVGDQEMEAKSKALLEELRTKAMRELCFARVSHLSNVIMMGLTILSSGLVVAYRVVCKTDSQHMAVMALIPGGIAVLATSLKLEARCSWHYRQLYGLRGMIRGLTIELPNVPTQEQLTTVSRALNKLEIESEKAWQATLSLDWKRFEQK
jgi:hypothetical protein